MAIIIKKSGVVRALKGNPAPPLRLAIEIAKDLARAAARRDHHAELTGKQDVEGSSLRSVLD